MSSACCVQNSHRNTSTMQCAFSSVVHVLQRKSLAETVVLPQLARLTARPRRVRCVNSRNRAARLRAEASIQAEAANQTETSETSISSDAVQSLESVEAFGFYDNAFVDAVSGEWFGYEVTFSGKTGAALPIEDRFVPDAYREWGVTITGFDTVSSTMVDGQQALHIRRTRAMPTVGCEADAIAGDVCETVFASSTPSYSTESTNNDIVESDGMCNGGFADGSFSLGPAVLRKDDLSQRWECAITHPQDNKRRARISFGRLDEKVSSISVLMETWDSPYTAGAVLPGCGGPHSSFADDPRTSLDASASSWSVRSTVYAASDQWSKSSYSKTIDSGPIDALALPRGLSVRVAPENDGMMVEAAWLADSATRSVVRRFYASDGKISFVEHAVETTLPH